MTKGHVKSLVVFVAFAIMGGLVTVLYPDAASAVSFSPQVFITEVQVRDAEFIELYNPGSEPISMQGWQLRYRGSGASELVLKSFSTADTILPESFLLLAHNYTAPSDTESVTFAVSLANEAGYLALYDADGTTVDLVGWGCWCAEQTRHSGGCTWGQSIYPKVFSWRINYYYRAT